MIRAVTQRDLPFMADMLYEAATVSPEMRALLKADVLAHPFNRRYIEAWGRDGDAGVTALDRDAPTGAAWYRLFDVSERGGGIVARWGVPEICIAVREDARGRGIGRSLIESLFERARRDGFRRLGLSVDPANPALRLYARCGFYAVEADLADAGASIIMEAAVR